MSVAEILPSPSAREHAQAIADGIVEAWRTYYKWSKLSFVHDGGIEAFISTKVAETLHDRFADACRVELEAPVAKLITRSGAVSRGEAPPELRSGGRVDVAFSNADGKPTGVVEVKRHFQTEIVRSDVRRVAALVSGFGPQVGGSVRWGAVVAMHTIWNHNKKDADERMATVLSDLAGETPGCVMFPVTSVMMVSEPTEDERFLGCAGLCLFLEALPS